METIRRKSPKKYNPNQSYPMLMFLHGAVNYNHQNDYLMLKWIELDPIAKYIFKVADKENIITVFPRGDKNYNYPIQANEILSAKMKSIDADYRDIRFNGFKHDFPIHPEAHAAMDEFIKDMSMRKREDFSAKITWEFDDELYGKIDWISDIKLGTLQNTKDWHTTPYNFKINKWLVPDENNNLKTTNVNINAFDFPRKSGKILAEYKSNHFTLQTSRIESFTILISPNMVDINKPIKIEVNGKVRFNKKISYNKIFMLNNFNANHDKRRVWVNEIKIKVEETK